LAPCRFTRWLATLSINQLSAERSGAEWRIRWRIANLGSSSTAILSAWLPHSRFRGREWTLSPPLVLPAGGEVELDSLVAWREPPGMTVENAFLILRLSEGRMFARLSVTAGPSGEPGAICEAVTAG
jgi:hypothetical protein